MSKTALICGVTGQDGAYLAELLLSKGYQVVGTSRDAQTANLKNLNVLRISDKMILQSMILTDFRSVLQTLSQVEPDEIYNLAGQSSVGISFEQPVETLESITIGTLNLLESIRFIGRPVRFYNAGSSECFGDTKGLPASEDTCFQPRSPYAVAKAAAHWEVSNYREAYGLYACTGILFNHESPLRPTRFVTRKIVTTVCRIANGGDKRLILGNIDISRDWGWSPEYVVAMWRMLQQESPEDYVVATGQSHTLGEFTEAAFAELDLDWKKYLEIDESLYRPSEIMKSVGNADKAKKELGWQAEYKMKDVVRMMIQSELSGNQQ